MVVPEQVSDDDMVLMAKRDFKADSGRVTVSGQIKVNVIRESSYRVRQIKPGSRAAWSKLEHENKKSYG